MAMLLIMCTLHKLVHDTIEKIARTFLQQAPVDLLGTLWMRSPIVLRLITHALLPTVLHYGAELWYLE